MIFLSFRLHLEKKKAFFHYNDLYYNLAIELFIFYGQNIQTKSCF